MIGRFGLTIVLAFLCAASASSGEWTARHDLIIPPGAPSLGAIAPPSAVLVNGPGSASGRDAWQADLDAWRARRRNELGVRGDEAYGPAAAWTRRAFTQDQVLIWDRALYDERSGRYTVDRFLDGVTSRIGPLDAVLLWTGYPNLGVDERNQFDLMRDVPGGVAGLRAAISAFHARGVHVLLPYLAWDTGTRASAGSDAAAMAALAAAVDADGVNFDGLDSVPDAFRAAAEARHHALVLEPQFDAVDGSLARSALGWSDWVTWDNDPYPFVPMVSMAKLIVPAHTIDVTDRYARVKTTSLQHAFFNGEGYALLENLWGFWYGMSARDAETVRRTTAIERAFPDAVAAGDWQPHVPTVQSGVFASRFTGTNATLWLLVNRNEYDVAGEQLVVPAGRGRRYYDLWHGVELTPSLREGSAVLSFALDGSGEGAVLDDDASAPSPALAGLLRTMRARADTRLDAYDAGWSAAPQTMTPIDPTAPVSSVPPGMVRIPAAEYDFAVRGNEIENGNDPGVDVQFPWESTPRRAHHHRLHVDAFAIDRTPVTNAEFAAFLAATRYHPRDDTNFVRDWRGGTFPRGWSAKPVTWVSLDDARAYARWAKKRLPHDWEWQEAAQSTDGRIYPWGNDEDPARVPPEQRGRLRSAPSDVNAHPSGASAFGVVDLVGDVSQWTDEFTDEHTRAAIVRGGASYRPRGSVWYFPQTDRLDEHEKLLLVSPGRDRSGTIGFRCVADLR